jgi:hypothetical protein
VHVDGDQPCYDVKGSDDWLQNIAAGWLDEGHFEAEKSWIKDFINPIMSVLSLPSSFKAKL